jgi:hypothetical protein
MKYVASYVHPLLRVRGLNRSRQIRKKNQKDRQRFIQRPPFNIMEKKIALYG